MKIIANKNEKRLDKFLAEELNISRSIINNKIKNKLVIINGNIASKSGIEIFVNDVIEILDDNQETKIDYLPYEMKLNIIYEDEHLIILNKPSGILTHPTQYNEQNTLVNGLLFYANNQWEPLLVHRLDKDTSGLIIFAKNKQSQKLLLDLFENRKIIKKYYALVHGKVTKNHFFIDVPISRSNSDKLKMIAGDGKNSKPALTEVELIQSWNKYSLLNLTLHTGRTHQIRVHLKYINHPIINDQLYSSDRSNNLYNQYLMSYYLEFNHPITNQLIKQQIDMDKEFYEMIENIKNNDY